MVVGKAAGVVLTPADRQGSSNPVGGLCSSHPLALSRFYNWLFAVEVWDAVSEEIVGDGPPYNVAVQDDGNLVIYDASSEPPAGSARWTLRLLKKKVVELDLVEGASDSTIGRVLKKTNLSPPQNAMGHPARSKRRFRSRHGGRAVRLYTAARSIVPGRSGGNDQATHQGNADAGA
jgi:hypothetical protein